uniref:Uncharacterized protein n=1 Tax=Anopheles arabiensis TaxID=7173 RepID=A0A182HIX0_ANOAR
MNISLRTGAGPSIGIALVPYYRQLLPMLNLYKQRRVNIGDHIDFRGGRRIGDVVNATLELLEQCGGPDAYLNIKYMVPTTRHVRWQAKRENEKPSLPVGSFVCECGCRQTETTK